MHVGKRASAKVYIDTGGASTDADDGTVLAVSSVDASGASAPVAGATRPSPKSTARKRVTALRLSHDISTEQLFSDQLIDGKVADGEDDDEDGEDDDGEEQVGGDGASKATAAETEAAPRHGHGSVHSRTHGESHKTTRSRSSHRSKSSSNSHSGSKTKTITQPLAVHAEDPGAASPKMYRIESHSHLSSLDAKHFDTSQQPPHALISATSALTVTGKPPSNRIALVPLADAPSPCDKCLHNKDMPPLHCAAYSGHASCLVALLDDPAHQSAAVEVLAQAASGDTSEAASATRPASPTRPYYLDKKRRSPLFYSCAANRIECCALLLRKRVEWRDLADKQLDTPVHVCCFFGWHECLQHLLDAGADPHGRNAKGFKPSHIAKTRDCLELLLSYGDDLQQGDKLGRTPLFVACARDRSICVEFLCAWNHQTRSWMLEQEDQRGDRPIHAAACNGSNASLEILLRYGADPLIPNAKHMTPKDLATANNHPRCVELLSHAEQELTSANAWFAPANAAGVSDTTATNNNSSDGGGPATEDGWIECWDSESAQPFYYNNLSGKCQWDVPEGFQPRLLELLQTKDQHLQNQQQQQQYDDDENGEYVWVKKKRQTVCVVTGKQSEWTAVQDPTSKAIYYKNNRTGQSQWEEPDAVQQLQSASAAQAAQQATKVWDELEASRAALAKALAADKQRQLLAQQHAVEAFKLEIQRRRDDIRKKEEQAKLQQLLPRSSFIRRKKQSMMIKLKGSSSSASNAAATHEDDDKMELICQREPSLDIFLSTYLRVHGVRDLQLSIEKRFFNCLFHYYVALVDPVLLSGLSKSQFRTMLRDAAIIPSSFAGSNHNASGTTPTLKLHIVDLIFAQAARVEALESSQVYGLHSGGGSFLGSGPHSSSHPALTHSPQHRQATAAAATAGHASENQLGVVGFVAAMQIVRERMVALAEELSETNQQHPLEIDDDEEWFLTTYVLPLTVRLGSKLLTQIRECKELDLEATASPALQQLLARNRHAIQRLHRYYSGQEPTKQLKMLSFRGLSQFALDFCLAPQHFPLPTLHQLYEAINWISGHAHTDVISFEKFQQLLTVLPVLTVGRASGGGPASSGDSKLSDERERFLVATLTAFFHQLEACPAIHRVAAATMATGTDSTDEPSAARSPAFFSSLTS